MSNLSIVSDTIEARLAILAGSLDLSVMSHTSPKAWDLQESGLQGLLP